MEECIHCYANIAWIDFSWWSMDTSVPTNYCNVNVEGGHEA
jgi:hypothetical protein